jgi:hypothetical protein
MSALLNVEVRRILARRLVRLFVALAVLGILTAGIAVYLTSSGGPQFELVNLTDIFKGTAVFLVLMAWLLAASFIGADWQSGALRTTLTWEPRRVRLLAAKVIAFAAVAGIGLVGLLALLGAALVPAATAHGTTAGADPPWLSSLISTALRIAALGGLAAVASISITMIGRRTSVAVGAGFLYLAVIEGVVRDTLPSLQEWLIGNNAAVLVDGHSVDAVAGGRSALEAGMYLVACAVVLLGAAAAWFRWRDIS